MKTLKDLKNKKVKTAFKAGDVLEAVMRFDSVDFDDYSLEETYRLLIMHVIKEESDEATEIRYTFVVQPVKWESPHEIVMKMAVCGFTEEQLLEYAPKKVGHIDISPLLGGSTK